MRNRFLSLLIVAVTAGSFLLIDSEAQAGRRHRHRGCGCGDYYSGCYDVGCCDNSCGYGAPYNYASTGSGCCENVAPSCCGGAMTHQGGGRNMQRPQEAPTGQQNNPLPPPPAK